MPVRKDPVRTMTESPLPVTAFRSSQETANRLLQSMYEKPSMKDYPLSRLSGAKTTVTYFRQKPSKTDLSTNISSFNDIDPLIPQYIRIEDFVLVFVSDINISNVESEDNQTTLRAEGEVVVLPNTIQPLVGDYFIAQSDESVRLYRITDLNAAESGLDKDPAFRCQYMLEEKNFVYEGSKLQSTVVDEKVLKIEYVGTNFKSVFDAKEAVIFEAFQKQYREYRDVFRHLFYVKRDNTFILCYKESTDENRSYATKNRSPDAVRTRNCWANNDLYDRNVIAFLKKSLIFFDNDDGALVYPTNYLSEDRDVYSGTVFDCIERQNYKILSKWFFEPRTIPYSGPGSHPVLFGRTELYPVRSQDDEILNLFPSGFVERLATTPDSGESYKTKPYSSAYDLISDILNLYINKASFDVIIPRLAWFCEEEKFLTELRDENRIEFLFYVLPILGFLFQSCMTAIATSLTEKAKEIKFRGK